MTTTDTQLATIIKQAGLAPASSNLVIESFSPLYLGAVELVRLGRGVEVKDEGDVAGIEKAREMRLKLRAIRCTAENTRKNLKDESLRYGKAIDRVAAVVKDLIEPVEAELEEQEKIVERMEAFRKSELMAARQAELLPLGVDVRLYALADMPEEAYQSLLATSKNARADRVEAERQAEENRKAAEEARAAEEKRVRAENERLRKEAAVKEAEYVAELEAERKKAKAACAAAEAAAKGEREAREKAEAEMRAQQAAAAAKAKADEAAKKKAARAPDREKIIAVVQKLALIELPNVRSPEAMALVGDIRNRLNGLASYIDEKAGAL